METGEESRGAKVVQLQLGTGRTICHKASKAAFPTEPESPHFSQKSERNRNVRLGPKPTQQNEDKNILGEKRKTYFFNEQ